MQPVAALLDTPLAKKVTDSVGNEVMELSDDLVNQLIDGLLNKHKATKDKEIQKLLLNPLKKLTPEFISSLVDRSQEQPIILIFEKCEKMGTENGENCKIVAQDEESSLLESWFCEMFLSRKNEFLKKEKHNVRFIISSRKSLTKRNDWNQLKEYCSDIYYEYSLKPFNKAQTKDFLKNKLSNKLRKKLSKTNESLTQEKIEEKIKEKIEKEKENYYKITHGHPKYLELICNQINKEQNLDYFEINDYSKINQNIAEDFLVDLSRSQKKVIKLVSCRRWLDRILIENLLQILKDTFTQEDFPADFPWFNWVKRRDFIFLRDNRYQVDELAQQVLGRCLFQQDREQFYGGHEQFAKYFRDKADELLQDKPTITKYNNSEWCEYMGEYLYHACFAQMKEFEVKFLEHLFALSYLNKEDVLKNSCKAIIEQANLKDQPLINSTNKKFLETLEFIATYSWVAFELNSKTGYGKYQAKIEATVHLCKNLLEKLESGIGKVAVLEFILKNLPVNCSEQERKEFEQSLSTEIDRTASNIDPNFSSRLYLQSAIWQTGNSDNILDWCDKAIKFKSNNANAWYRQGKFFQKQAKEILQKDKKDKAIIENLYTALDMYDKALKIQPFDHRFWKFRADVLVDLGDNFLSVDKQILDLVDSEKSQGQKDNNCSNKSDCLDGAVCECQERSDCDNGNDCENKSGSILQRAAYYRRAYDSYSKARIFRPKDKSIEYLQSNSKKKHDEMLKKCNSAFSISVGKDHSKSEEEHHSNGLKYDSLLASILDELDNSCLVNTLANIEQEKDLHDLLVKLNDTKLYKILNKLVEQLDDSQLDIIFNKLVAYILNKLAENPDQDNPDKKLIDDILTGSIAKLVESQSKNIWKILKGSEPKLDKNQFNNDSSVQKYNQRNPELVNNYIQLIRILKQLYDDNRLYDHRLLEILKIDNANHKNSVKEAAISLLAKILYGLLIQDKYLVKIKQENQPNKSLFNTVLNELLDQHKQENQLDNTWLIKLLQHLVNNSNNTLLVKILHCIDKSDKLDYSQLIKILDYIVDPLNYRQLDPPNYIQLINIGDDLRLKPEYHNSERAIDCYDRAIRMNPEQPLGWYCRGLASTELGKNDEEEDLSQLNSSQGYLQKAINDYEKSLELKNDLDWAFYDRGIAYYWMGRIKEKKAQLKEKKAQQKAKEEYRKAIKDFDEAIKINSEYDDAWFYRGLVLHCLKYYDQAIASYDKAIQICHSKELIEGEVKYLYNRGLSYEKLELYDEAIASYEEAISYGKPNTNDINQDKENYIKNWYQWGLILLYKLKKYPEAIEKFKQVTELQITLLNNKHKGALYNWGYALYELKEYSQACHQFEEVTNLNNNHEKAYYYWHEKAYYYWGLALYKLKNYSEACDKFEQVVTYLNPKHEKAYYYWGLALYDWANWGLPLYSWFNSFLYIYAWYYCVLALYELEKYSEAYDKFEQETLLNSEHKDAWYYYVLALYAWYYYVLALYAWYYYVLALYTCYFWGLALYEVEKYSGACDKFEQVTNLNPEHEDALDQWYSALNKLKNKNSNNLNSLQEKYENAKYSCGLAFYKQGEYKKAIRQFETVIELNKEHERAWHYFNLALNKVKDKNLTNDKEVIDLINKHGIDWHEFGDTLKKEKEYEKAITQFEAIIKLNDKDKISWDLWVLALAKFVGCKKVIKWFMEGIKNCNKFAIKQYYRVEARFKSGLTEIVLDKEEEAQDKQKATQKT